MMHATNDLLSASAPRSWVLELTVLGAVTAAAQAFPWMTSHATRYPPHLLAVMAIAAVGSGVAGLLVAQRHAHLGHDTPPRSAFVRGMLLGAGLGLLVGAVTGSLALLLETADSPRYPSLGEFRVMAMFFGPCGAIQGGWYVPAASWLRRRGRPSWPLLVVAPVVAFVTMAAIVTGVLMLVFLPCQWQHCEG